MITTIIFDIGNVLADFTWREHYERFGFDEKMIERLADATVRSPLWNEYDKGVMTYEELFQGFVDNDPEIEPQLREVFTDVSTMVVRNDYAIPGFMPCGIEAIVVCICRIFLSGRIGNAWRPLTLFPIWTAASCLIRRRSLSPCRRSISF